MGLNLLEIRGADIKNAESAKEHISNIMKRTLLFLNNDMYPKYMLLDARESREDKVVYEEPEKWWPYARQTALVPRLEPCAIMYSTGAYWEDMLPTQRYAIQREMKRALDRARFKQGYYELSVRVGCLAVNQQITNRGNQQSDEFMKEIIVNAKLDCDVKKWYVASTQCC